MADYGYCEFGHLLAWRAFAGEWRALLGPGQLGHAHEGEALSCAYYESVGWPRG